VARFGRSRGRQDPPPADRSASPFALGPATMSEGLRQQLDHSPRGLREQHLLLLPSTVMPGEVDALVRSRVPHCELAATGEVRLGRRCRISGPVELTMEDAVDAAVPMPWTLVYALQAPIEREDPPPPGLDDRDGLGHAFPRGMPWREEGRALQLLVALARRLHGAVRVAGGGLIQPDPDRAVDVVIHAPGWLDPEVVHGMAQQVLPAAQLATSGRPWHGPDAAAYTGERIAADTAGAPIDPARLAELHAAADAHDLEVLAGEDTIDAYAVVAELPHGDGAVEVLVHVSAPGEPAVAGTDWGMHPFVSYEVRWSCPMPDQRERRHPDDAYVDSRERVRPQLHAVAGRVVEATGGVVTDEDGFTLDRYAL
jgi:hypothetical protein